MMTFIVLTGCCVVASGQTPVLGVSGASFTLDGKPTFLLGASYYGALGIEDRERITKDLDDLVAHGINWIRVWATWDAFDNNVSAVAPDGSPRSPFMERLERLCRLAGRRGMVVDITVSRGRNPAFPASLEQHQVIMKTLATRLRPFRNLYFDIANERGVRDARHVPIKEVGEVIRAVKQIDPQRLCTASGCDSDEEARAYIDECGMDFICPHRARNAQSPAETEKETGEWLAAIKSASRLVPVHYQEPFRRDYGPWQPVAADFITDLEGARRGGAAGWCFHNGDNRNREDGRPRRSFDMRPTEGRLFDQLDAEERAFLAHVLPKR